MNDYVVPFERLGRHDVDTVGGKNSSLGEMISSLAQAGVRVPGGFATTAHAYREFLAQGGLDERIRKELANLDVDDVEKLAATGARIREWILSTLPRTRARRRGSRPSARARAGRAAAARDRRAR